MRWYDRKTGERIEGANLKIARENGHLPSVTGIINEMFHSYGLTRWKFRIDLEQLAHLNGTSQAGDAALAEYMGKQQRERISAEHSAMHDWIARAWDIRMRGYKRPDHPFWNIVDEVANQGISGDFIERRLVSSKLGFCGQPDAYSVDLIDWKFTTRGEGGYREKLFTHGIQLAGYNQLIPGGAKRWVNVIISAKDPNIFRVLGWSDWEKAHLGEVWKATYRLWCLRNKYDPRDDAVKMKGALQVRFKTVWEGLDPDQKRELAKAVGTRANYLSQIAHGHAKPSRRLISMLIEHCKDYEVQEAAEDFLE